MPWYNPPVWGQCLEDIAYRAQKSLVQGWWRCSSIIYVCTVCLNQLDLPNSQILLISITGNPTQLYSFTVQGNLLSTLIEHSDGPNLDDLTTGRLKKVSDCKWRHGTPVTLLKHFHALWFFCIWCSGMSKYQTCLGIIYKCTKEHGKAQEDSQVPYVSICNRTLFFRHLVGLDTLPVFVYVFP